MTEELARRDVRTAIAAKGLSERGFAKLAKVDPGTLSDFLNGERWPQFRTLNKIEAALGWQAGRITQIVDGLEQHAERRATANGEALVRLLSAASPLPSDQVELLTNLAQKMVEDQ